MHTPNLRHLEIFQILMKTRSLTETARLMHVTQPAVSQALRDLEGQLGIELFSRGGGRIRPTNEAIVLLPEVERLFSQVGSLTFRATELRDTLGGQLNIAAIPVLAVTALPAMIAGMLQERPRLRMSLQSVTTSEVLALVKSEIVELGFTFGPVAEAGIGMEPLFETRLTCLMPRGHPLAAKSEILASDLRGQSLVTLSASTPPGLVLRDALRRSKAESMAQVETNSASAAIALVRALGAIAVTDPLPILDHQTDDIVVRPFEPPIKLTIAVAFSRHRAVPKIALQFIKRAQDVLAGYAVRLNALGVSSKAF